MKSFDELCKERKISKEQIIERCKLNSLSCDNSHTFLLKWNEKKEQFLCMYGRKIKGRIALNGNGYLTDDILYNDTLDKAIDDLFYLQYANYSIQFVG